eukprot:1540263-Prymnesium_polylepis.2
MRGLQAAASADERRGSANARRQVHHRSDARQRPGDGSVGRRTAPRPVRFPRAYLGASLGMCSCGWCLRRRARTVHVRVHDHADVIPLAAARRQSPPPRRSVTCSPAASLRGARSGRAPGRCARALLVRARESQHAGVCVCVYGIGGAKTAEGKRVAARRPAAAPGWLHLDWRRASRARRRARRGAPARRAR